MLGILEHPDLDPRVGLRMVNDAKERVRSAHVKGRNTNEALGAIRNLAWWTAPIYPGDNESDSLKEEFDKNFIEWCKALDLSLTQQDHALEAAIEAGEYLINQFDPTWRPVLVQTYERDRRRTKRTDEQIETTVDWLLIQCPLVVGFPQQGTYQKDNGLGNWRGSEGQSPSQPILQAGAV